MVIRIFNEAGIDEFSNQLKEIKSGDRKEFDRSILESEKLTADFSFGIEIEERVFITKKEISEYLCNQLDLTKNKSLYYNRYLWSWLSAFYFDSLITKDKDGKFKVNEEAKYILMEPKNWRKYYRHLLASSARLYCELGDIAAPFLSYPVHIWSDLHEQLLAYQQIATNPPLIQAVNNLYWDSEQKKVKRGATSKKEGSPRRFSAIIGQFEMTYDLNAMSGENILTLLPEQEFKKWLFVA